MSRLWAIGDVHGFSLVLERMLERIAPEKDDTIVMLGDYIDRGPDACGVIERLLDLQEECHCVTLRGNHEEMLLSIYYRALAGNFKHSPMKDFLRKSVAYFTKNYSPDMISFSDWLMFGGRQTLASYGWDVRRIEQIPQKHLEFIKNTELYYETEHHIFVHAAYDPALPMDEQSRQTLLFQKLKYKIPAPHCSGKKCYVGHSAQRNGQILNLGHIVCIDTCLYGGGRLTAVEVNTGETIQLDASGHPA